MELDGGLEAAAGEGDLDVDLAVRPAGVGPDNAAGEGVHLADAGAVVGQRGLGGDAEREALAVHVVDKLAADGEVAVGEEIVHDDALALSGGELDRPVVGQRAGQGLAAALGGKVDHRRLSRRFLMGDLSEWSNRSLWSL